MIAFLDNGKVNRPLSSLRPMLACVLGITLLTVACNTQPTRQSSVTGAANQSNDKIASNEKKLVCHDEERTGTRFKSRICKYQTEWDAIEKAEIKGSEEYTRKTNERSAATSGSGPGGDSPYSSSMPTPNNP